MNTTPETDSPQPDSQPRCRYCGEPAIDFCKHCGQEFCLNHRSRYQARLCSSCITDQNVKLEREPVVDEDGTVRKGRRLRMIGEGWPYSIRLIQDLSDEELESHIAELGQAVKQAQLDLDYSKILYSAATFDLEHRQWSRAKRAKKKREAAEQGSLTVGGKTFKAKTSKTQQSKDPIDILANQMSISREEAMKVLQVLGKAARP